MYRFDIKHKNKKLLNIIVKSYQGNEFYDNNNISNVNDKDKIQVVNIEYNQILNSNKNKIELYYENNVWDKMKKIINPYELIYITNKKVRYKSISLIEPLSRSFFKMIEMSHIFLAKYHINPILNLVNHFSDERVKTLHLAEGPGGFVEAWRYFRNYNKNDLLYAITLLSNNKEIPSWKKTDSFIKDNPQVKLLTGLDGTGNLYNPDNINYVVSRLKQHSINVITGDGGFDFSIGYNIQEQYASKLIFCQVLLAIKCQKIGGTFICKFFDTNNKFTIDILYLLQNLYETITIYKPFTSRVANSERYIICSNYLREIDDIYWKKLLSILYLWNNNNRDNKLFNYNSLFNDTPISFINFISTINYHTINHQVKYINDTIDIIKNKKNDYWYETNRKKQHDNASKWCIKFNIPYNF